MQIEDLQKEIRDIHAYTVVYKDNSLVRIDEKRSKPTYSNLNVTNSKQKQHYVSIPDTRKILPVPNRNTGSHDPFRVKNCLIDVELEHAEHQHSKPLTNAEQSGTVRKRLKRSRTATGTRIASKEYQTLLPGKRTSYYSIRKYYEQEKDKLLHHWSPEERRKRTVKMILSNNTVPQFSVIRKTTTSAIFRDFKKYKTDSSEASSEHSSLPPKVTNGMVSRVNRSLSDVG